jgi:hypothetical protein
VFFLHLYLLFTNVFQVNSNPSDSSPQSWQISHGIRKLSDLAKICWKSQTPPLLRYEIHFFNGIISLLLPDLRNMYEWLRIKDFQEFRCRRTHQQFSKTAGGRNSYGSRSVATAKQSPHCRILTNLFPYQCLPPIGRAGNIEWWSFCTTCRTSRL